MELERGERFCHYESKAIYTGVLQTILFCEDRYETILCLLFQVYTFISSSIIGISSEYIFISNKRESLSQIAMFVMCLSIVVQQ